jgi:hypothetical protein
MQEYCSEEQAVVGILRRSFGKPSVPRPSGNGRRTHHG